MPTTLSSEARQLVQAAIAAMPESDTTREGKVQVDRVALAIETAMGNISYRQGADLAPLALHSALVEIVRAFAAMEAAGCDEIPNARANGGYR